MLKRKYFTVEEVLDQIWNNEEEHVEPTAGIDTHDKNDNIEDDEKLYAAINPGSDEESGAEDEPIFSEDEEIVDVNVEESLTSFRIATLVTCRLKLLYLTIQQLQFGKVSLLFL